MPLLSPRLIEVLRTLIPITMGVAHGYQTQYPPAKTNPGGVKYHGCRNIFINNSEISDYTQLPPIDISRMPGPTCVYTYAIFMIISQAMYPGSPKLPVDPHFPGVRLVDNNLFLSKGVLKFMDNFEADILSVGLCAIK